MKKLEIIELQINVTNIVPLYISLQGKNAGPILGTLEMS